MLPKKTALSKKEPRKPSCVRKVAMLSIDGRSTIRRRPLLLIANYSLLINCAVGATIGRPKKNEQYGATDG